MGKPHKKHRKRSDNPPQRSIILNVYVRAGEQYGTTTLDTKYAPITPTLVILYVLLDSQKLEQLINIIQFVDFLLQMRLQMLP